MLAYQVHFALTQPPFRLVLKFFYVFRINDNSVGTSRTLLCRRIVNGRGDVLRVRLGPGLHHGLFNVTKMQLLSKGR